MSRKNVKKQAKNGKNTPAGKKGRVSPVLLTLAIVMLVIVGLMLLVIYSGVFDEPEQLQQPTVPDETSVTQQQTQTQPEQTVPPTETEPPFQPLDLGDGLVITDIGPYTGAYVEDGSDAIVSDVLMVILENTSDKALQYARINLNYTEETAEFSVTNLPAGQRVVLLELNRMEYRSEAPDSFETADVLFVERFEMYEDIFEITGEKGTLTVKNISDTAISGDIYVYYKNSAQDLFYGGITYRARVEGGLEPGETKRVIAAHLNPTGSTILMVTYIP